MIEQSLLPVIGLIAVLIYAALKHVLAVQRSERQSRIARDGMSCEGKVVAIQRPFILDHCTRVYFDYRPEGQPRPLRACHVDRRAAAATRGSLPQMGAVVSIKYLADHPNQAVIRKLVE